MKRILIVDDSAFMRRVIRNIVTKNGYDVVGEATDGLSGIEKYRKLLPDVMTMDLVMDEMNGMDALKQIIEEFPEANIIMVSSMSQDVIVRDAIVLGAKNFIHKPFDEEQVMDALNNLNLS